MLFRHCSRIISKQKFAEKRFSNFRIIRIFASVHAAKSIPRAAGLGAGIDECLLEEDQSIAQLHFGKET
jgi:hypothetical protein